MIEARPNFGRAHLTEPKSSYGRVSSSESSKLSSQDLLEGGESLYPETNTRRKVTHHAGKDLIFHKCTFASYARYTAFYRIPTSPDLGTL